MVTQESHEYNNPRARLQDCRLSFLHLQVILDSLHRYFPLRRNLQHLNQVFYLSTLNFLSSYNST